MEKKKIIYKNLSSTMIYIYHDLNFLFPLFITFRSDGGSEQGIDRSKEGVSIVPTSDNVQWSKNGDEFQ